MSLVLQVITVFLVAIAMSQALAHALELPGKLRLDKATYIAVQAIYYPGFTFGGLGEGLGTLATLVLMIIMPNNRPAFEQNLNHRRRTSLAIHNRRSACNR